MELTEESARFGLVWFSPSDHSSLVTGTIQFGCWVHSRHKSTCVLQGLGMFLPQEGRFYVSTAIQNQNQPTVQSASRAVTSVALGVVPPRPPGTTRLETKWVWQRKLTLLHGKVGLCVKLPKMRPAGQTWILAEGWEAFGSSQIYLTVYQLMWKHFSILPTERPSQSLPADFWSEVSIRVYPPQDVQEASTSLEAAIVGFWVRCPGCVFAWTSKHWFLLGGSSPYGVLRSFSFSKRDIPDLKASPGNCPIWGTIRYVQVCDSLWERNSETLSGRSPLSQLPHSQPGPQTMCNPATGGTGLKEEVEGLELKSQRHSAFNRTGLLGKIWQILCPFNFTFCSLFICFQHLQLILEWEPKARSPWCLRNAKEPADPGKQMPARDPTAKRQILWAALGYHEVCEACTRGSALAPSANSSGGQNKPARHED